MNDLQYLRHRVVWGRGQPAFVYRLNDFQVIDVIADVGHLTDLGASLVSDASEVAALVGYTLKQVSKLELRRSAFQA